MSDSKNKNLHSRHRERMRRKFVKHGFDAFTEHELVEFMLFYAMPRGNTNEIAHRLVNEFDSLENIVTAPREQLLSVKGIGENTAIYLEAIRQFSALLRSRMYAAQSRGSDTPPDIKEYFLSVFMGVDSEIIYAAGYDSEMKFVSGAKIADGELGQVVSPIRKLYDFSCTSGCSRIVIAHNHPHSDCLPSPTDVYNTADLVQRLRWLDIDLMDHIIVGEGGALSLRSSMHAKDIWK